MNTNNSKFIDKFEKSQNLQCDILIIQFSEMDNMDLMDFE
jgi:hypothetical protein